MSKTALQRCSHEGQVRSSRMSAKGSASAIRSATPAATSGGNWSGFTGASPCRADSRQRWKIKALKSPGLPGSIAAIKSRLAGTRKVIVKPAMLQVISPGCVRSDRDSIWPESKVSSSRSRQFRHTTAASIRGPQISSLSLNNPASRDPMLSAAKASREVSGQAAANSANALSVSDWEKPVSQTSSSSPADGARMANTTRREH